MHLKPAAWFALAWLAWGCHVVSGLDGFDVAPGAGGAGADQGGAAAGGSGGHEAGGGGNVATGGQGGAAGGAGGNATPAPCVTGPTDDFEAPTLDLTKWLFIQEAATLVGQQDGVLNITVQHADFKRMGGLLSNAHFDASQCGVLVEVPLADMTVQSQRGGLSLVRDDGQSVSLVRSKNVIAAQISYGASPTPAPLVEKPYDSTAHRWFAIGRDVGVVVWLTSDGNTWQELARVAEPFSLDNVRVYIGAVGANGNATEFDMQFDNVNLPP